MTGVTILRLDEGLDTGPVITAQAVDIDDEETAGELTSRLAELGARLVTGVITPYLDGTRDPGATLVIDGERHQLIQARAHEVAPEIGHWMDIEGVPVAGLSDGGMELVTLLPAGKREMSGGSWLRGRRRSGGTIA